MPLLVPIRQISHSEFCPPAARPRANEMSSSMQATFFIQCTRTLERLRGGWNWRWLINSTGPQQQIPIASALWTYRSATIRKCCRRRSLDARKANLMTAATIAANPGANSLAQRGFTGFFLHRREDHDSHGSKDHGLQSA